MCECLPGYKKEWGLCKAQRSKKKKHRLIDQVNWANFTNQTFFEKKSSKNVFTDDGIKGGGGEKMQGGAICAILL